MTQVVETLTSVSRSESPVPDLLHKQPGCHSGNVPNSSLFREPCARRSSSSPRPSPAPLPAPRSSRASRSRRSLSRTFRRSMLTTWCVLISRPSLLVLRDATELLASTLAHLSFFSCSRRPWVRGGATLTVVFDLSGCTCFVTCVCSQLAHDAQTLRFRTMARSISSQFAPVQICIAFYESSWCPQAYNGICCYGLWQINKVHLGAES